MLSGEATNTNFIVFGLTRSVLEPTIYHTRDEHDNHYTTDEVRLIARRTKKISYIVATISFVLDETAIYGENHRLATSQ